MTLNTHTFILNPRDEDYLLTGFRGIFMKILILILIFFCFSGYSDISRIVGCNELDGAYKGKADFVSSWSLFDQTYDVNIASSSDSILVQIKERDGRNISCTQFFDPIHSNMSILSNSILNKSGFYNDKLFPYRLDSIRFQYFFRDEDGLRICIARGLFYLNNEYEDPEWWELRKTESRTKSFSDLSQECNALTVTFHSYN